MRHGSSGETILVVEDAEPIRKMICSMLEQNGYTVLEAGEGTEALRLLEARSEPVHLVLTDVIMPLMNGTELAKRLDRIRPELPILFMSGYADDPIVRSVEHVSSLFLPKPFTATALMEKVRRTLDEPWHGLPRAQPGACPR